MLKSRFLAGTTALWPPILMSTEGFQLVRWQWWMGLSGALALALVLFATVGLSSAVSFVTGCLAILLGGVVSGWYGFRGVAPSGHEAMLSMVIGAILRWVIVGGVLIGAFSSASAKPLWVLVGVVFGQAAAVVAALTFKRR